MTATSEYGTYAARARSWSSTRPTRATRLDPLAQATTHAPDVPQFAGPAPPTRRTWTPSRTTSSRTPPFGVEAAATAAVRAPRGVPRGDVRAPRVRVRRRRGGGGWGAGFRRRPGFGSGRRTAWRARVAVRPHPTGTRAHVGRVTALKATPDGLRLVSAGTDNRVRLWDLADGKNADALVRRRAERREKATTLAVTADGRRVYHPSSDGDVLVFDVPAALARGKGKGRGRGVRGETKAAVRREVTATKAAAGKKTTTRALGRLRRARESRHWSRARSRGGSAWAARNARARDADARGVGPTPLATLRGHLAAACAVAIRGRHGRGVHGRRGSTRARVETRRRRSRIARASPRAETPPPGRTDRFAPRRNTDARRRARRRTGHRLERGRRGRGRGGPGSGRGCRRGTRVQEGGGRVTRRGAGLVKRRGVGFVKREGLVS